MPIDSDLSAVLWGAVPALLRGAAGPEGGVNFGGMTTSVAGQSMFAPLGVVIA